MANLREERKSISKLNSIARRSTRKQYILRAIKKKCNSRTTQPIIKRNYNEYPIFKT